MKTLWISLIICLVLLMVSGSVFGEQKSPYAEFLLSSTHICYVLSSTSKTPEMKTLGTSVAFMYPDKKVVQIGVYDTICAYSEADYQSMFDYLKSNNWNMFDLNNYKFF